MAYGTTNPPALIAAGLGGVGQIWRYESTHATAVVDGAGFVTNGLDLGMRAKDLFLSYDTSIGSIHSLSVVAVTATGADLTDGTAIGSTANAD